MAKYIVEISKTSKEYIQDTDNKANGNLNTAWRVNYNKMKDNFEAVLNNGWKWLKIEEDGKLTEVIKNW